MTRFARAKGSKSSNLKAPDDSTPWEVMKEQMLQAKKESEDNKNRELAENQRIENYKNFLKEQKVQKRKSTWCDFPETESNKKAKQSEENNSGKNKKLKKIVVDNHTEPSQTENVKEAINSPIVNNVSNKKKKKKNRSKTVSQEAKQNIEEKKSSQTQNVEETLNSAIVNNVSNKKKKNKTEAVIREAKQNIEESDPSQTGNVEETLNSSFVKNVSNKKKKKEKKTKTVTQESQQNIEETDVSKEEIKPKEEVNNKKKNKHVSTDSNKNVCAVNQTNKQVIGNQKFVKPKKKRADKPTRRKEINDKSFQLIINGKEVQLIRFDGFPIMKKDAERLNELKTSMIKKGIPKTEVNRTIKLERRRAEKALARLKKDVCYNCRKGGHNLSDCPDLKSSIPGVGAAEGICFKCGSTEHRQFECKVQRDKEFRFASCFICKEQGHIARQCPDNPKGLYPNGGCCKLCGDVTHLRKDCPTIQNQKEGTSIKLQTMDVGNNIEDIDLQSKSVPEETSRKPKKIKF